MPRALRVLIVEDSEDDALLVVREVKRGGFDVEHRRVETVGDFRKALREDWDLVLSDFNLPHMSGLEALSVLKETGRDVPFILVSGRIGEEGAVDVMKAGAHDYVMKDRIARLVPVIRRELQDREVRVQRREAVDALRQSKERYAELVNSLDGVVWEADPETLGFTFVSPQAERILGYPPDQWLAEADFWRLHIHPTYRDWTVAGRREALRDRRHHELEYPMLAREGATVWVKDYATVAEGPGGGARLRGILVDATNMKRTEEALLQRIDEISVLNQLLDAQKGELSTYHGMLTHDVSNFAMVLLGVVERLLLQADGPLTPRQDELLRRANRQVLEMNRIAENARLLIRLRGRGMPAAADPVRLSTTIRRAVDTVRTLHFDRPFDLRSECPEALSVGGVALLDNVLLNLIDNAVRHSPKEGRPKLSLEARAADGHVVIRIRGGAPPPRELLAHLFEREAKRARPTGHGLGLSLVREIVQCAGGKIEARAVPEGEAQVFEVEVSLPRGDHGEHPHP